MINVVRSDGTGFRATPLNLAVEKDLYTRYELGGAKDLTIEMWFADEIESPFVEALSEIVALRGLTRSRMGARDPRKTAEVKALGFVVDGWREQIEIAPEHHRALVNYLAAMLVRNPRYIAKIQRFHEREGAVGDDIEGGAKTVALDNMLWIYELYRQRIAQAQLSLLVAEGDREFFFSDNGVAAQEPWRAGPLPFDVHAPLTPKMAVEVHPVPHAKPTTLEVMRVNSTGVARFNKIVVGNAERFVFSRSLPPLRFIQDNFGAPAAKSIGVRWVGGRLETRWDKARER